MLAYRMIAATVVASCLCSLLCGCARDTAPALAANLDQAMAIRQVLEKGVDSGASGDGGGASLGDPTGFATLSGTFRIVGSPPPRQLLRVDKDTAVCSPGGKQILSEEVVTGPNGGIKNVLIFVSSKVLTGDPKWEHESYAATKTAEVEFDQKECVFLSHVFAMRSTQTLKILNSDPVGHNTNIASNGRAAPFNQTIPAGVPVPHQFGGASASPFPVSCSIHPWMTAHMAVFDHPFFSVTDAEGRFEIPNVPAGVELEFRVWQEKSGYLQDVTVTGGPSGPWDRGRFKITLQPDQKTELDVAVNASVFQ